MNRRSQGEGGELARHSLTYSLGLTGALYPAVAGFCAVSVPPT